MNSIYQHVISGHREEIENVVTSLKDESLEIASIKKIDNRIYHVKVEGVDIFSGHDNKLRRAVDALCEYECAELILEREVTTRDRYLPRNGNEPFIDFLVQSVYLIGMDNVHVQISYERQFRIDENPRENCPSETHDLNSIVSQPGEER